MNNPFDKLSKIKPEAQESSSSARERQVERIAEARGFTPDEQPVQRSYKRPPGEIAEPTTTATLRPTLTDWNEFVEYCKDGRLSYREGFSELMKLLRASRTV